MFCNISASQRNGKNDTNNNQRALPVRRQGSHGNLISSQPNLRGDQNGTLRSMTDMPERKGIIKRTKSFWKFGRHNSEEILAGMAMWKHRDLVDVSDQQKELESKKVAVVNNMRTLERNNKTNGSERSNDSDRTLIKTNQYEENGHEIYGVNEPIAVKRTVETHHDCEGHCTPRRHIQTRRSPSFKANQKLSLPSRNDNDSRADDFDDNFDESPNRKSMDDQFYDDEGDGLMLRTVNRKNILQQYNNDSTGGESDESESEMTSDDPYDCIVVDDHTTLKQQRKQKNGVEREGHKEKYPNVAEIGKKLERLSKSKKFNPDMKEKNEESRRSEYRNNKMNKMTAYNNDRNKEMSVKSTDVEQTDDEVKIRRYNGNRGRNGEMRSPSPAERRSFKTFGHPGKEKQKYHDNSLSEPEMFIKPRHFEKKYHEEKSENDKHSMELERREKMPYYSDRRDEYGEENEKRTFLPRTKLVKTNSTMQTVMKFEQEIVDYDEAVRGKAKKNDYEDIPNNGNNVYGPWYDLWGLDATVKK